MDKDIIEKMRILSIHSLDLMALRQKNRIDIKNLNRQIRALKCENYNLRAEIKDLLEIK